MGAKGLAPGGRQREQSFASFCERSLALEAFCGSSVSFCKALLLFCKAEVCGAFHRQMGRNEAEQSGAEWSPICRWNAEHNEAAAKRPRGLGKMTQSWSKTPEAPNEAQQNDTKL